MNRSPVVEAFHRLKQELARFGVVGLISFVVDMGLFNLLADTALEGKITTSKVVSGAVATLVAWIGNRFWTFRHRRNRPIHHELLLFLVVNGVALAISALWVAFAHYVLHLDGKLWLNVNGFFGIGLGTIFRFWTYRAFVFQDDIKDEERFEELSSR